MAESIVTLGIGGTPVSLFPFITSGLLGAVVNPLVSLTAKARDFSLNADTRDFSLNAQERDFSLTAKDRDT